METHFCDRLRSCDRDRRRSQTIAEDRTMFYLLRSSAIVCDPLRSLVSFAAVFRLVTQRSSPQTAAFFRTTFLSLCLSVQAIDQSYHNHCLKSSKSHCSKKTFPRDVVSANMFRTHRTNKICVALPMKILDKNFQFVKRGRTDTQQNIS